MLPPRLVVYRREREREVFDVMTYATEVFHRITSALTGDNSSCRISVRVLGQEALWPDGDQAPWTGKHLSTQPDVLKATALHSSQAA